jgi:hypothetical protein
MFIRNNFLNYKIIFRVIIRCLYSHQGSLVINEFGNQWLRPSIPSFIEVYCHVIECDGCVLVIGYIGQFHNL